MLLVGRDLPHGRGVRGRAMRWAGEQGALVLVLAHVRLGFLRLLAVQGSMRVLRSSGRAARAGQAVGRRRGRAGAAGGAGPARGRRVCGGVLRGRARAASGGRRARHGGRVGRHDRRAGRRAVRQAAGRRRRGAAAGRRMRRRGACVCCRAGSAALPRRPAPSAGSACAAWWPSGLPRASHQALRADHKSWAAAARSRWPTRARLCICAKLTRLRLGLFGGPALVRGC